MNARALVVVAAALLAAPACGGDEPARPASSGAEATPEFPPALDPYQPVIEPADFVSDVDNPYMPLMPGTTHVYDAVSEGEKEKIVVTVTDRTRTVMGVDCTVVKDVVTTEGELVEKTFDWFAQDRYGNVWYFGELSKEYENGKFSSTKGSWTAGVDGALPGIVMLGEPATGDRYRQEFYEGEAEDMGEVVEIGTALETPSDRYTDVLVTKDWNPLEPGVVEQKYYAAGIGLVFEEHVKGPKGTAFLSSTHT